MAVMNSMAVVFCSIAIILASLPNAQPLDDLTKSVTKDDCMNGTNILTIKLHCCQEVTLSEIAQPNSVLRKCINLTIAKKGPEDGMSESERRKVFSAVVHCYYKRKKYMGPGQSFNMTRIKADAERLQDPFQTKFIGEMYEICALAAKRTLEQYLLENSLKANDKDLHARMMFFQVAYICVNHYSETTACPYFHWGALEKSSASVCQRYADHCRELMQVVKQ